MSRGEGDGMEGWRAWGFRGFRGEGWGMIMPVVIMGA